MGADIELDLSEVPVRRLTVQQYADAWRVAHVGCHFGKYNQAGYEEVLKAARVILYKQAGKFALIFTPVISAELEARCDAYCLAMRKNRKRP